MLKKVVSTIILFLIVSEICCAITKAENKGQEIVKSQERLLNHVADWPAERAKCRPVPMSHVRVSGFLGRRIDMNSKSILPGMESPIPRGFEARAKGKKPPPETRRLAADSDLYKWLEGACYVFAQTNDADVKKAIGHIAGLVLKCQSKDGYINTQTLAGKWVSGSNHDLYIAGHFFEAAVAHFRATGQSDLLEAACRWADYLIRQYENKHPYFKGVGRKEHSEYELGFLRLYRATGHKRYLDFAITLAKMCTVGPKVSDVRAGGGLHAVRVGYLLTSLADIYLETGQEDCYRYLPGLWKELVDTRMYITGGIGYREGISRQPFFLPQSIDDHPRRDIAETCASIAMMMLSWRMHSITGQSRSFDVIENILYNHCLGSVALNHLGNFYYNPLRLIGDQTGRTDHNGPKTARCMLPKIHSTACCLPNCWRFFGALPEYIFSYDDDGLLVNLYTSGTVHHRLADGKKIQLTIETRYPHDGKVVIRFDGNQRARFQLRLRIPAWCQKATMKFGGRETNIIGGGKYFTFNQTWQAGDTATLTFEMPVRMVFSDPRVEANAGQVVFARGPLIYCLENQDVDFPVQLARVALRPEELKDHVRVEWRGDLLSGVNVLYLPGIIAPEPEQNRVSAFTTTSSIGRLTKLMLIPFYARANRSEDNRWVTFVPLLPKP